MYSRLRDRLARQWASDAADGPTGSGRSGANVLIRPALSAERQRDVLFDRVSRLQEVTVSLASTGTVADVIDAIIRLAQRALGADAAVFAVVDGDAIVTRSEAGDAAADMDGALLRATVDSGAPVFDGSWAALPLHGESAVLGAIGLHVTGRPATDDDEIAFAVAVATQCATAYERAVALESERDARRVAEAASRRLRYLVEATGVLSQSLDPQTTMQRLAELAVPTLADWCAVHLVEGDVAVPVAMASEDPALTALVRELSERHPVPLDAPAGLGAVVRTGEPVIVRSVTMDAVEASTSEPEVVDLLSRLRSIAIVPMTFQGQVLGTVTLSNVTDRALGGAEVDLAGELAARAAQAVSNARLYQDRARVASTLQASLLPRSPTRIPGVDVATRFVAGAEGLDVGGDFYDVFRLGTVEDPAPTWAMVIGDVRGKGADAAAITGIARSTIRATALDETSPALMLARLNQVLLAASRDEASDDSGDPRFCTACVATVTPTADGADVVVAVGGHPLPYVVRGTGVVEQVGAHGGLLGIMSTPGITDANVHLAAGDAFVLYTDGVTERHAGPLFFDEDELARVLTGAQALDADALAERVERAAHSFVSGAMKDDLAVVVARIDPSPATGTVARTDLPADDRAAALARRFVADALEGLGAVHASESAALLASELVTNALLHGSPPFHIEVLAVPDGLRLAVTDGHPDLPVLRSAGREDEHGRGLLLVEALSARWGVDARPPGKTVWFELAL